MLSFKGAAKRIDDVDLPRLGAIIGVGEDELHAFMDVESAGSGFRKDGSLQRLFEPHKFYRHLGAGTKRDQAVKAGVAYSKWNPKGYKGNDSKLQTALTIDRTAALKSTSWGLTQILGEWYKDLGYATVEDMVAAFTADEENHLAATIKLLIKWGIDDDLRAHRWAKVAEVWNGPGYRQNKYDTKMAAAFAKWSKIKDTSWDPKDAYETPRPEMVEGGIWEEAPVEVPPVKPIPQAKEPEPALLRFLKWLFGKE